MRNFLLLCTKDVHFGFDSNMYQQNDGVAMVTCSISHWKSYVDDTFVFIEKDFVEHVLACLNLFHKNIQFMYEWKITTSYHF